MRVAGPSKVPGTMPPRYPGYWPCRMAWRRCRLASRTGLAKTNGVRLISARMLPDGLVR